MCEYTETFDWLLIGQQTIYIMSTIKISQNKVKKFYCSRQMLKADKRRLFSGFIEHHFQNFMGIRTYLADVAQRERKKKL